MSAQKYRKDMWIWADHPDDVWMPARIVEVLDRKLKVSFLSGKTELIRSNKSWSILSISSFDEDMQNDDIYKDLSKMAFLSTESVLHALRKAYHTGTYYSNLGAGTILAINPFQDVEELFNEKKVHAYNSVSLSELSSMPAHVFAVAERSLRHMLYEMERSNQSIIISGESGAGKTWTVRCLMRYLAIVGMETASTHMAAGDFARGIGMKLSDSFLGDQIEHRILSSNPILEAFGNAATPRNHNSSRFGKYIQLQYDRCGDIVGAKLQVYLLEKTRVANHSQSEKPYHIFSQLIYGSSNEEKEEWQLPATMYSHDENNPNLNSNNNSFDHLNGSSLEDDDEDDFIKEMGDVDKMDDEVAFKKTRKSMISVGILPDVQSHIFKILSAILHLERMSFEGVDDLSTPCTLTYGCQSHVKHAANLLAVPINSLLQAVTVREIQAGRSADRRRSVFKRSCTRDECSSRRDALMKYLYEQIFLWLVRHIGDDLSAPANEACSFIGLLDVYGFESFQYNGLEQLCINYANEKLQQYYVNNFLKLQQEELAVEGVMWEDLETNDKTGCLSALESPHNSLFALLNEECRLNRASNALQLKDRISEKFSANNHIMQPRISSDTPCFVVLHYAGTVMYQTDSLIAKNKDELPLEIATLLTNSSSGFMRQLISKKVQCMFEKTSGTRGKYHETVLTEFKKSLDDLIGTLSSTNCHYIRCIKPNKMSVPSKFDSFHVVDQLRSSGVVETVQICGHLHPHQMAYSHFIAHFEFLKRHKRTITGPIMHQDFMNGYDQLQQTCHQILNIILAKNPHIDKAKSWKFGKTFIFLSAGLYEALETERSKEMSRSATKIQVAWLSFCHRMRCRQLRRRLLEEQVNAAVILQRIWKNKLHIRMCRRNLKAEISRRNNAAIILQSAWTKYTLRQKELEIRRLKEDAIKASLDNDDIEMSYLIVQNVGLQHATLQNSSREVQVKNTAENQSVVEHKIKLSFEWTPNSTHHVMCCYFPSMKLKTSCSFSFDYDSPSELLKRQFSNTDPRPRLSAHGFYENSFTCSFSSDFSISSNISCLGGHLLSPHSFNFNDSFNFYKPRTCILPYSDVIPKCKDSAEILT